MKLNYPTALTCLTILILAISSCGQKDQPAPDINGIYYGTSTPSNGSAYPDTVNLYKAGVSYTVSTVHRSFHNSVNYYSVYFTGNISGINISVADTTINLGGTSATYSTNGSVSGSTLTLHDKFVYTGGSSGTSTFVGVLQ
jgi:hypothetical protein